MGVIRLILALSVVIVHSKPIFGLEFVDGIVAVQAFYMISGFYMALILNEKYTGTDSYKLFLSNRCLRLFPTYLVVLALTFLVCAVSLAMSGRGGGSLEHYLHNSGSMGLTTKVGLIFANLFLFGQDAVMFFQFDGVSGAVSFAPNYAVADVPLSRFMLVPQAWTIAVELTFYLMAPLLVRRSTGFLLLMIVMSLALRFLAYGLGYGMDPWTYRFFPFELAFFLTGTVGYRVYKRIQNLPQSGAVGKWAWGAIILATVLFSLIPISGLARQWSYYGLFACALPFVFHASNTNRLDRWIGELSYPVYLSHWLILLVIGYGRRLPEFLAHQLGLVVCLGAIAFSLALARFVISPIERIRQARVTALSVV